MKKYITFLLVGFVVSAGLIGCGKGKAVKANEETVPVKIMKVRLEDVSRVLEYIGNIKGQDEAVVYPKVSGKIIEKVNDDGSAVAKGEVIAYIDRDEVGIKFEKAPVESPLAGTVGRVYVDIGSSVNVTTAYRPGGRYVKDRDRPRYSRNVPAADHDRPECGQERSTRIRATYLPERSRG